MQVRGFLIGGTAGRTSLAGEGLQHQDGHSHLLSATVPNCVSYDPAFAYELAVIVHDGLRRMYQEGEKVFYYITVMNENYTHPEMPKTAQDGILRGMYKLSKGRKKADLQLLGSGTILREVIEAADILKKNHKIVADVWSVTSFSELQRDGAEKQRWNLLHSAKKPKISYVEECLSGTHGPIVATSDYMRLVSEQIRPFVPRSYSVLGTDGFGRSDCRKALREFFEVDRYFIVIAALKALADDGVISNATVSKAISKYGIDPEKPNPLTV